MSEHVSAVAGIYIGVTCTAAVAHLRPNRIAGVAVEPVSSVCPSMLGAYYGLPHRHRWRM
jgi:hypothetical protein